MFGSITNSNYKVSRKKNETQILIQEKQSDGRQNVLNSYLLPLKLHKFQ